MIYICEVYISVVSLCFISFLSVGWIKPGHQGLGSVKYSCDGSTSWDCTHGFDKSEPTSLIVWICALLDPVKCGGSQNRAIGVDCIEAGVYFDCNLPVELFQEAM